MLVRSMKALVLIAGCLGAIGFFEPFFHDRDGEPVSAYRIAAGFDAEKLQWGIVVDEQTGEPMSSARLFLKVLPVPLYFISTLMFLFAGFASIVVGRFSGMLALGSASAALLALGGFMREVNVHSMLMRKGGDGATLLLVSGLLGLVGSLVVLVKREPDRPKPPTPPPELPVARVIS